MNMAAANGSGGPPGLGGSTQGLYSGFQQLARVYVRAGEVRDTVEQDQFNIEKYVKEVASLLADAVQATGKMFEEERMRMINMVTSVHLGGLGGGSRYPEGIMEDEVIQGLRAVNRDKGLFRQWHQKFTTVLGQVRMEYEEIVHRLAREIDFGKNMENMMNVLARRTM